MTKVTVQSIAAYHDGDWHDKPLKWSVTGPASEVQNFCTKKDAMRYASIRRKSTDFATASREYCRS